MRTPFRHLYWLLLPLHACSDPTYVEVHITTDVPCERLQGVALTFGALGSLEDRIPATRTAQCNGSEIGTIVVVPSAEDDGEFGLRVVMGIERDVDSCTAPGYGDGCVVARRGLRFLPGESVTLPIVMRQICNGIPCGPYDTCVKGSCVPATCKTTNSCTEDTLVENAAAIDGGADGGDAQVPGDDREPVSVLTPFCGTTTSVDLNAGWPMKHGCPSRAGVSRFRGPLPQNLEIKGIASTAWPTLAVDDGELAWGTTESKPARLRLSTSPAYPTNVDLGDPPNTYQYVKPGPCALLTDEVLCGTGHGVTAIGRDQENEVSPVGTFINDFPFDGGFAPVGFSPYSFGWAPFREGTGDPVMFVVYHDPSQGFPLRLHRIGLGTNPSYLSSTVLDGQTPGEIVVSPDGSTIYVPTDSSVAALDAKTGLLKWKQNHVTAVGHVSQIGASPSGLGLADPSQRFHVVVSVAPDGGPAQYAVRTFTPTGQIESPDLPVGDGSRVKMVLGRAAGLTNPLLVVAGKIESYAYDLTTRAQVWKSKTVSAINAEVQMVSTDGVVYVAGLGKLLALSTTDGKVVFEVDAPWGGITDMAIGPNRTLYVAGEVLVYSAALKKE